MTAVYPEPKEGSQRLPEYKFGHFTKLPVMQLFLNIFTLGPLGLQGMPEYILNHNIKLLLMQL